MTEELDCKFVPLDEALKAIHKNGAFVGIISDKYLAYSHNGVNWKMIDVDLEKLCEYSSKYYIVHFVYVHWANDVFHIVFTVKQISDDRNYYDCFYITTRDLMKSERVKEIRYTYGVHSVCFIDNAMSISRLNSYYNKITTEYRGNTDSIDLSSAHYHDVTYYKEHVGVIHVIEQWRTDYSGGEYDFKRTYIPYAVCDDKIYCSKIFRSCEGFFIACKDVYIELSSSNGKIRYSMDFETWEDCIIKHHYGTLVDKSLFKNTYPIKSITRHDGYLIMVAYKIILYSKDYKLWYVKPINSFNDLFGEFALTNESLKDTYLTLVTHVAPNDASEVDHLLTSIPTHKERYIEDRDAFYQALPQEIKEAYKYGVDEELILQYVDVNNEELIRNIIVELYQYKDLLDYNSKICYFLHTVENVQSSRTNYTIVNRRCLNHIESYTQLSSKKIERSSNTPNSSYPLTEAVLVTKNKEFKHITLSMNLLYNMHDKPFTSEVCGVNLYVFDLGLCLYYIDYNFTPSNNSIRGNTYFREDIYLPEAYVDFFSKVRDSNSLKFHLNMRHFNKGPELIINTAIKRYEKEMINDLFHDILLEDAKEMALLYSMTHVSEDKLNDIIDKEFKYNVRSEVEELQRKTEIERNDSDIMTEVQKFIDSEGIDPELSADILKEVSAYLNP